jgi:hypothetical protein
VKTRFYTFLELQRKVYKCSLTTVHCLKQVEQFFQACGSSSIPDISSLTLGDIFSGMVFLNEVSFYEVPTPLVFRYEGGFKSSRPSLQLT